MKLSEYGFFTGDMKQLIPAKGVMPYHLNTPLFTDFAEKARFVALPTGAIVPYNDTAVFDFPEGTSLIKNFYYPVDFRDPSKGRRIIETRLLIREASGWRALPYIWNEAQTDAELDVAGETTTVNQAVQQIMNRVRTGMSRLLFQGKPGSVYAFGLLNGLLPCSMVYMALAGAIATGEALKGAGFMFVFGLGTLPAMWSVSIFSGLIRQELRIKARKLYPAVMAVIGILLILRGLNLDIPYISPALHLSHSNPIECHD